MKSDDWTNLWVKWHEFIGQPDAISVSKIIVVDSPLASVSSPAMCSWLDFQYQCVSSCGCGLNSDQKAIGYPTSIALRPLVHPWSYPATPVIVAVHRAHGQIKPLITTSSILKGGGRKDIPDQYQLTNFRIILSTPTKTSVGILTRISANLYITLERPDIWWRLALIVKLLLSRVRSEGSLKERSSRPDGSLTSLWGIMLVK